MFDVVFVHPHPLIGRQRFGFTWDPAAFLEEVAPARTFGFAADADMIRSAGLAQGASPANVLVLTDDGVLENALWWPD